VKDTQLSRALLWTSPREVWCHPGATPTLLLYNPSLNLIHPRHAGVLCVPQLHCLQIDGSPATSATCSAMGVAPLWQSCREGRQGSPLVWRLQYCLLAGGHGCCPQCCCGCLCKQLLLLLRGTCPELR
jgi:hypothetical protein